jgi:hypothetical protein
MKLLFTMYREGGFVDRNWVKGSGIYYRERFSRFGVEKFYRCDRVTHVKLYEPKLPKPPFIKYSSDPAFLTHFTFVRTSKDFWVKPPLTHFFFSVLGGRFGIRFTVGGAYE